MDKKKEILFLGTDHQKDFPVYEKKIVFDENGDQHEEFVQIPPDELAKRRSMSLLGDAINGSEVVDTSHFDKFQLMDMLEQAIDLIPEEQIQSMLGKKVDEE